MKYIFSILLCLSLQTGFSQIIKTVGISYTSGTPTYTPSKAGSALALDTVTWRYYTWNGSTWLSDGYRIQTISGCSAPAYTPTKFQSYLVINACTVMQGAPELYFWTGSAWLQINEGQTYTAGTGVAISGGNVISNTGDLSVTNELNTSLSVSGSNLQIVDAGGTLTVPVSGIAPVQAVSAGTGISISGTTTRTITSTITQADGSETKISAGSGISKTGTGTTGDPYTITNSSPSKWTDGGAYTYLTSTTDRVAIGSASSPGAKVTIAGEGTGYGTAFIIEGSGGTDGFAVQDNGNVGLGGYFPSEHNVGSGYGSIWMSTSNCGVIGETQANYRSVVLSANAVRQSGGWNQQDATRNSFIFSLGYESLNNGLIIYRAPSGSGNSFTALAKLDETKNYLALPVGMATTTPTSQVDIAAASGYAQLRLRTSYTPASSADALGNTGDTAWDANYFYIKTAAGWKRTALSTF